MAHSVSNNFNSISSEFVVNEDNDLIANNLNIGSVFQNIVPQSNIQASNYQLENASLQHPNNQSIIDFSSEVKEKVPSENLVIMKDREIHVIDHLGSFLYNQISKLENIVFPMIKVPYPAGHKISEFIRGSRITLFEGGHLIPYNLDQENIQPILENIAFNYVDVFQDYDKNALNFIFSSPGKRETDFAIVIDTQHEIFFKQAKSCIDGRNCFLFMFEQKPRAIIGIFSLYLSWIALGEQGSFSGFSIEEALKDIDARDKVKSQNIDEESDLNELLVRTERLETQLTITKKVIAEELGISLENLIIIPQTMSCIDMELFVTPEEEVVVHDDELVECFILQISKMSGLTKMEKELYQGYLDNANNRKKIFRKVLIERKMILENSGLKIRYFPAVFFHNENGSHLNYCNGIFLEKLEIVSDEQHLKRQKIRDIFYYITTGPSLPIEIHFHVKFTELFNKKFPRFSIHGIEGLSSFVFKYGGGVRSLTSDTTLL